MSILSRDTNIVNYPEDNRSVQTCLINSAHLISKVQIPFLRIAISDTISAKRLYKDDFEVFVLTRRALDVIYNVII